MADDQVKYSDLFDAGIIGEVQKLTNEITSLKDAIAAAKTEANGLRDNLRGAGTATREQQQQTAADAAAVEALNRQVKDLTDKLNRLEAQRAKYGRTAANNKKLTDAEAASVEALRQALAGSAQDQIKATQAIDMQSKSYNELYQTYNALKDALNRMTVAERENSQAGKEMVNRAKEIRDTLNNLQQATGNYTLNVGNYMSAMNGLQFQTQQVLREIPSAQNLSQFFLAISNNIPMFTDALARYNKGLPEARAKLAAINAEIAKQEALMAGMNVQSTEYAAKQEYVNALKKQEVALQGATVSGWKAVWAAVGSWQTLIIAGLLLLRKVPDMVKAIANQFNKWFKGVKAVNNEMSVTVARAQLLADVTKKVADEATELDLVVQALKDVKKGSDEWKAGVATVAKITKDNKVTTAETVKEVERITEAYKKQAEQVAKNQILSDMIAKSEANRVLRGFAAEAKDVNSLGMLLGIKADSKDFKEMEELFEEYDKWSQQYHYFATNPDATMTRVIGTSSTGATMTQTLSASEAMKAIEHSYTNATTALDNFINKRLPILSAKAQADLRDQFELVDPLKTGKGNKGRQRQPSGSFNNSYRDVTMADVLVEEANAMSDKGDTVLQTIQMWYDKRVAITNAAYEKEKETLAKEREERNKSLTDNLLKAEQFKSKYDALVAEVDKDPYLDDEGKKARKAELKNQLDEATKLIESASVQRENIKKYYDERELIAEQKKQNELADLDKQRTEKLFKEEERRFKARQDADKRRFDLEKHNSIEQAKFNMEQEIASKQWQIDHAKELELSEEQLAVLKEEVEWLNKKYNQGNYNAKRGNTGNYSNIMDVLFGEKITSDQISAINSVFDQAKEALNSWMDARKAAADQAKELADDEVSAAENALNREIELRNQGYANNVALRERELADAKEKQKQAVEEQNKIAKEQILLDAAMQTSSLITASANIIKQFPNPLAWVPMLATMWGAFGYAKIKAYQASTKSITFGEGGSMLLEGGSHQSGHDVNLGIGPDGSNLRAEGGEYFAVINKRNSRKYGSEIPGIVNALNSGMFEDRYIKTSDAVGLLPRIIRADDGSTVDLSAVESGVGQLVKQGETSYSVEGGYRVMRYKNLTRRVKIS